MNSYQFSIPYKTFLIGEYLAIAGGLSIIINTRPRFELILHKRETPKPHPFHPHSPAGRYLNENNILFKEFSIFFKNHSKIKGGFGASTASFAMLTAANLLLKQKQTVTSEMLQNYFALHYATLLDEYRKYAWDKQGLPPSGADLIAQTQGNISCFEPRNHFLSQLNWPFNHLSFLIFKTKKKIATHNHLKSLTIPNTEHLARIAQNVYQALKNTDEPLFIDSVNQYADELQKQNLTLDKTSLLRQKLLTNDAILAAKGCGALGADVIIIFCRTASLNAVSNFAMKNQLTLVASNKDLSSGIEFHNLSPIRNEI